MRDFHALLVALDRYPRPVVAAINGHCVGGGMEIVLSADTVLAVPTARFGFPEINHGLLPADKGIARAVRVLGTRVTREMVLSGDLFDASRAVAIGLVDALVNPTGLVDAAIDSARKAGAKAPVLYRALKRSVNDFDDDRDAASLQRTLVSAAEYFDDPVARPLREGWNGNRSQDTKR
jgi:enoyl-CoA hydratase/carnithine racemase